jgi:hypothetical protein
MSIKDPINKTCWKNDKDPSKDVPKNKLWNYTKKRIFRFLPKKNRKPWMKLKIIFAKSK